MSTVDDRVFAALHLPGQPLVLPNAWDFASAAALVQAGFMAVGTTSLGVAVAHGLPDATGATRAETLALVHRLARLPVLLTVDVEAGFSDDPAEVGAFVHELASVGVVGVNVEDSRPGEVLAPIAAQVDLISAIRSAVPGLFINARTDTHWVRPPRPLAETLRRAAAFRAAGADGLFVPGLLADDEIRCVVAESGLPLNVLAGRPLAQLAGLGVARVSTGSMLLRSALRATVEAATPVAAGEPVPADLPTYDEIAGLVHW